MFGNLEYPVTPGIPRISRISRISRTTSGVIRRHYQVYSKILNNNNSSNNNIPSNNIPSNNGIVTRTPEILIGIATIFKRCVCLPQIIKIIKTQSSRDVSALAFMILITGTMLQIPYYIKIKNKIDLVGNTIAICTDSIVLLLIYKYQ